MPREAQNSKRNCGLKEREKQAQSVRLKILVAGSVDTLLPLLFTSVAPALLELIHFFPPGKIQTFGRGILALPFASCETLGRLFNFSVLFLICKMDIIIPFLIELM